MILRWLISFSIFSYLLSAATLSGTVQLKDSRDPKVNKNKDAAGVVFWLTPKDAPAKLQPKSFKILQKNKRFEPHVLPVAAGATVEFPNLDPIFHNAFSNFDGKVFDLGLYPPGQSRSVKFDRPGIVRLFCNIHSSMSAVIVVLNTPYFGITSASGRWEVRDVPPGEYTLGAFHERSTAALLKSLERVVRVPAEGLSLPLLVISESGYEAKPHQNKFGAAYAPIESNPIYPGAKR